MKPLFGLAPLQEVGTSHEPTIGNKGHSLWNLPGDAHLPGPMEHVYNDLVESGHPPGGHTYGLAVGIVQNWAHGKGAKDPKVIATAQKAVEEWMRLRAEAHARHAAGKVKEAEVAPSQGTGGDGDYDLDDLDMSLPAPLVAALQRLLSGYTEEALEAMMGQPSDYLKAVLLAKDGYQNVQEERVGRIAEDWVEEKWSAKARAAAAEARRRNDQHILHVPTYGADDFAKHHGLDAKAVKRWMGRNRNVRLLGTMDSHAMKSHVERFKTVGQLSDKELVKKAEDPSLDVSRNPGMHVRNEVAGRALHSHLSKEGYRRVFQTKRRPPEHQPEGKK